jgi:hypothetical protein
MYLGCFIFDSPGERERTGSFQIVVTVTNPEEAVARCQRRLRKLRATKTRAANERRAELVVPTHCGLGAL